MIQNEVTMDDLFTRWIKYKLACSHQFFLLSVTGESLTANLPTEIGQRFRIEVAVGHNFVERTQFTFGMTDKQHGKIILPSPEVPNSSSL